MWGKQFKIQQGQFKEQFREQCHHQRRHQGHQ
jgi:hypothetical protein